MKLRIYLQDGTLQSGNLINETAESFVVLTKDGRVEVPKGKIMFINGKTIKQWQDRPDKLFQTEILPSEIPNPSYVNDKTALPTISPPASASKPIALPKAAPVVESNNNEEEPAASTPVEATPVAVKTPVSVKTPVAVKATAATPAMVVPVVKPPTASNSAAAVATGKQPSSVTPTETKAAAEAVKQKAAEAREVEAATSAAPAVTPPAKHRKHRAHTEPVNPTFAPAASVNIPKPDYSKSFGGNPNSAATAPPAPAKPSVTPNSKAGPLGPVPTNLPARFNRVDYSQYYYQQAMQEIADKRNGAALHSLHMAAVLNRQDPEPTLMLGKIYLEQGMPARATKYLSHPILKKRPEAIELLAKAADLQKSRKTYKRVLYGATGAGLFAWIPFLLLLRRFRRAPRRVITADTIIESPFASKPTPLPDTNQIEKVIEELIESPSAKPEPAFMRPPTEMAGSAKPMFQAPAVPVPAPPPNALPVPNPIPEIRFTPPMAPARPATPASMPPAIIPLPAIPRPTAPMTPPPAMPEVPATAFAPMETVPTPAVNSFTPPAASLMPDTDAVLRLATMVERAVRNGNALAMDEQFDQARREYRTALALNPACLEAHLGMAFLSFSQGQLDLAMEHYVRCLKIDASSADAHYGIGRVLLETDRVEEAVMEFQQTLVLDPSFDDARETLTSLGAVA